MNEKILKYLDGIFSPYEDLKAIKELKEELLTDLHEKWKDLKNQGYDNETAYHMTIDSIGDISEIIESISEKTRELKQQIQGMDFSKMDLRNSDFKGIIVTEVDFGKSDLRGSDFSGSDLSKSSFKYSDLRNVSFDGANLTDAKLNMVDLTKASFKNSILDYTDFSHSDLSGVCFDHQTFNGTIFNSSGLKGTTFKNAILNNVSFKYTADCKKANFDGATVDKLTYAVLKGNKANLEKVTII